MLVVWQVSCFCQLAVISTLPMNLVGCTFIKKLANKKHDTYSETGCMKIPFLIMSIIDIGLPSLFGIISDSY